MVHFKIMIDLLTLIVGSGVVVTLFRGPGHESSRGMRLLGLYLIFHNLLVLADLGYRYCLINILGNDLSLFSFVFFATLVLIRISADAGYTWFLFSALRRFAERRANRFLLIPLFAFAILTFGFCIRGIEEFGRTGSIDSVVVTLRIWILGAVTLVFCILLHALGSSRRVESGEKRRSIQILILALLAAYLFILIDELSFYHLGIRGIDLGNVPVFAVNLVLLLWVRFWLAASWKTGSSIRDVSPDDLGDAFGISPREMEVIEQLLSGKSNKEIQQALFISPSTVKNHLTSIYRKTGVDSRTRLVALLRKRADAPPANM